MFGAAGLDDVARRIETEMGDELLQAVLRITENGASGLGLDGGGKQVQDETAALVDAAAEEARSDERLEGVREEGGLAAPAGARLRRDRAGARRPTPSERGYRGECVGAHHRGTDAGQVPFG